MEEAGTIIIKAKLSANELEKELARLKKQLEKYESEAEKLASKKLKLEFDTEKTNAGIEKIERELDIVDAKIKNMKETNIPERLVGNMDYQKLLNQRDSLLAKEDVELLKLSNIKDEQNEINSKLEENQNAQTRLNSAIDQTAQKYDKIKKSEGIGNNIKSIEKAIGGVGNSIEGVIKKVTRWGLAIFGIRSAYMLIRQEMSVLSGYNKQLSSDLEYVRFAIATSFQKIIENIIQLVYKLLTYVAYLAKAWFDVDLFANASTKAFEKANKGVKATNKSAKELQKTITGFDEMNILNKDGSVGAAGAGAGSFTPPSVDLSQWDKVEVPGWIKWLAENGNLVKEILIGIGAAMAGIKIAELIAGLGLLGEKFTQFQTLLLGLAIGAIIYGIYETIKAVISFMKDPTWENFNNILRGLTVVIMGVAAAMIAFNATNPVGWITLAISGLALLVDTLTKHNKKLSEEEVAAKRAKDATKALKEARDNLRKTTDAYINAVDNAEMAAKELADAEKKNKMTGEELVAQMEKEGKTYADLNPKQKELYKAYINNKNAQDDLSKATKDQSKAVDTEIAKTIEKEIALARQKGNYEKLKGTIMDFYNSGKISADDAAYWIARSMNSAEDSVRETFMDDIPKDILSALDTNKYTLQFAAFQLWWRKKLQSLNGTVTIKTTYSETKSGNKKGAIAYFSTDYKIPKLASGGIINQPGRGVPLASAIGGEKRAEGVIPLTDSQQMALLGEAIGKYITINANIVNSMNGRVISRELQKISNESDFAFNG